MGVKFVDHSFQVLRQIEVNEKAALHALDQNAVGNIVDQGSVPATAPFQRAADHALFTYAKSKNY